MRHLLERLEHKIAGFLRTSQGNFDELAIELFAHQFQRNRPYQAYCQAQGHRPETIQRWQEIPAVPIAAFKSSDLATFPVGQAAAVWESSGTTRQIKSR